MVSSLPDNSPYRLIYKAFRAAGIVTQEGRPWSIIYAVYHVVMINLFGTTAVVAALWGRENLSELIMSIASIAIYAQVIFKQLALIATESKLQRFLARMECYRQEVLLDKERKHIVDEADKVSIRYAKLYSTFFLGLPLFPAIKNFYVDYNSDFESPHLVFQLYVPWKMNTLWPYIAGNFFCALALTTAVVCCLSYIIMQFLVTFQFSAYLRVLQNRIETNGPRDKYIYYHHKKLTQLINEYNDLFCGILYEEVILTAMHAGFGYALIKAIKSKDTAAFDLVYKILVSTSGPFIMCACGEEINQQVEKLHESSYSCKWYEEEPKVRRDIFTMMLITTRPITVNYRLFIAFNLPCFATISKGFYSYLTMIINFDEN